MKNVQVIDRGINCTYSICAVEDNVFRLMFPRRGQDIEFAEDLFKRLGKKSSEMVSRALYRDREIDKRTAQGIHGTIFYQLLEKKEWYPNKRESDLYDHDVVLAVVTKQSRRLKRERLARKKSQAGSVR